MVGPLTPSDCDLRDFAYMPLDTARILDSDLFALATGEEFKAAFSLWCKAWQQLPAASLPDDDRVLAHLSGSGSRWRKVRDMALRGWIKCSDGRLYHPVVAEKARDAWAKKLSYRDRSKKGNEKRWGSQKDEQQQSLKDASPIPKGVLEPPKGEGSRIIQLSKDNCDSVDLDAQLGTAAKAYLGPSRASLIGKWKRDHGIQATMRAITAAQHERAVDPVSFIEACFRTASRQPVVPI